MTAAPTNVPVTRRRASISGWQNRLIASRGFQKWAAHFPLTKRIVRRDGEALFDLLAGFCHSQILTALVELDILNILMDTRETSRSLAHRCNVPEDRMIVLLRAAVALGLLKSKRKGRYALGRSGAALVGVPGLADMIRHHDVLYRDLADPAAFFRGTVDTELAQFWPYVFGGEMDTQAATTYSNLMAESQILVAEDTLRAVPLKGASHLMDVGGGTGAFLEAAGLAHPHLSLTLFDLPQVVPAATERFKRAGLSGRAEVCSGSFRADALPTDADAISLVRVLYDHADDTVADLLAKCFHALPAGGQLVISEPMSGGDRPDRATDAYFALYTLAMRTGKTRSAAEIVDLCADAGFVDIKPLPATRPFVTSCMTASKP